MVLVVLFLLTACYMVNSEPKRAAAVTTENTWTSKASLPDGVSIVKVAVVNGKIYVMTGSTNYEYDPATDNWTTKAPMPTPRTPSFGVAVYQNKIYVMGGQDSTLYTRGYYFLSTNEVYDPLTDTWETKAPMPTSRDGAEANVVNGKIYVISGKTYASDDSHHSNDTNVNEVYDPATDAWTTKQPAPIAVERYASTVVDNKIYIMGGTSDQINDNSLQWVSNQIYDVENDTWSLGASLPTYTYNAAAGATTGLMAPKKIYVMGGGFTTTSNTVLVYDLTLDNWSFGAPMPINRSCLAVAVVNDVMYAMGGTLNYQGTFPVGSFPLTNVVEQYIPFGYGTVLPAVQVVSLENNVAYSGADVSLIFTLNKAASWMAYSLDGQDNITVTGNVTLAGLSDGLHNVTVYAEDSLGNMGASETIVFNVASPFPTVPVAVVSGASAIAIAAGLLIYFKKRKY